MIMTGPNILPIAAVPNCCMTNKTTMMLTTIGIIGISGKMLFTPSTADEIEMAGVIKPSAISVAQPMSAGIMIHLIFFFLSKANKAKIPPSPLLSAFSAK